MSFFTSDTAYDNFMGRYSKRLAAPFADFAGIRSGLAVVDVGAGTGALTSELVSRGAQVAAAEPAVQLADAMELLGVEAAYTGFDEFWDALLAGAGPAGAWAASLDTEAREAARAELHRQVGEPAGAFRLTGRAWATRARRA